MRSFSISTTLLCVKIVVEREIAEALAAKYFSSYSLSSKVAPGFTLCSPGIAHAILKELQVAFSQYNSIPSCIDVPLLVRGESGALWAVAEPRLTVALATDDTTLVVLSITLLNRSVMANAEERS